MVFFPRLFHLIGPIPAGETRAFLGGSGLYTRYSGTGVLGLEYVGGGGTKVPKRYSAFEGGASWGSCDLWLCAWGMQQLWS